MRCLKFTTALMIALGGLLLSACSSVKKAAHVYSLGERVELGHLVYTIYDTQWLTQLGQGVNARLPKDRFFLVRVSADNTSGEELEIPAMTLESDSGQSFDEVTDGDGIPEWLGLVRRIQPIQPLHGYIAFDAPAAHYKLLLTDENQEQTAYVDIPLTYGTETGELPAQLPNIEKDQVEQPALPAQMPPSQPPKNAKR